MSERGTASNALIIRVMIIKLLTLNVWHGGKLMDPMLAFLERENPDILLIQEASNETQPDRPPYCRTVQMIQDRLHYEATDFAPAFTLVLPELKVERGNAVLSRFQITSSRSTFFNEPYSDHYIDEPANFATSPRNLQHVTLDTPAGNIDVFNFQGVWDLAGDNYSPARQRMSDVIIEAISGLENVLLAGDTNAKPTNQAIRRVDEHLRSVYGHDLTTTFNMRRKTNPGYATAVVDMIFASPSFELLSRQCPDIDVSDHLPVIATFKIDEH